MSLWGRFTSNHYFAIGAAGYLANWSRKGFLGIGREELSAPDYNPVAEVFVWLLLWPVGAAYIGGDTAGRYFGQRKLPAQSAEKGD